MKSWIFAIGLATACAAYAQQPAPAAGDSAAPGYSVVEPKVPPKPKAKGKARSKAKAKAKSRMAQASPRASGEPQLKRSGPCVVKPVMTDQDLVNCGAKPPRH